MNGAAVDGEERIALKLSLREWLVVGLLALALLAVIPSIPFRPRVPVVDRDYRIPYALSTRYAIYHRFTTLAAAQFPSILVGDSVVWGQTARNNQTLSHHLNELTKQPRFANAGLDGMHPLALVELIEHHAPAIERKDVILQFDPLWLLDDGSLVDTGGGGMKNHPGLMPRLAASFGGTMKEALATTGARLLRNSPLKDWSDRLADARLDFLAWSLDHPYENPGRAITATLPPSEDSHPLRLTPWNATPMVPLEGTWGDPEDHPQWKAFERLLTLLQTRNNRVFVLVGPMNEHMMSPALRNSYATVKSTIESKLKALKTPYLLASLLPSEHYQDICHPLGAGYEELARELLRTHSAWLLGLDQPH